MGESYKNIKHHIINNKIQFNRGENYSLYNKAVMEEHIDKYLKETTSPDPNKYKRKQI